MYLGKVLGDGREPKEAIRELAQAVNAILNGNINSGGSVTLTASSTTTTVTNRLIGTDTIMILAASTANAAAAADVIHQAVTAKHQITLTHDSNAAVDRTYKYVLLG